MDNNSLDFGAKMYCKLFTWGGEDIYLSQTIVNTWVIMAAMIIIAIILRCCLKKFKDVPTSKLQVVIEMVVGGINDFVGSTMGANHKKFAAYFGPLIVFIGVCNLSGLLYLRPPTADLATTLAFALITFFMIQGFGLKSKGIGGYLKGFLDPIALLLPINIIGELANPVSLSFRLFGNILGGSIIMGLIYAMFPKILTILPIPAVLHCYFDLFAGLLQAFIFCMLSMTFISNAMDD